MEGIIGKKIGMTQVYDEQGRRVSVTVLEAGPCPVVRVKTPATEKGCPRGVAQLAYGEQKPQRLTKAELGHLAKAQGVAIKKGEDGKWLPGREQEVKAYRTLKEFDLDEGEEVKAGDAVTVGMFAGVRFVDVTGVTKGRGFAGVVRRYGMRGGPMTHGGHSKRRIGGIGARDLPGWVEKGKRMPGHMGAVNRKARNLRVVEVRGEENLLLVEGSVPGAKGGLVFIRKALKK